MNTSDHSRVKLACQCNNCTLPFAYIQRGVLVIEARHGGDKHTNVIRIEDLAALVQQMAIQSDGARGIMSTEDERV